MKQNKDKLFAALLIFFTLVTFSSCYYAEDENFEWAPAKMNFNEVVTASPNGTISSGKITFKYKDWIESQYNDMQDIRFDGGDIAIEFNFMKKGYSYIENMKLSLFDLKGKVITDCTIVDFIKYSDVQNDIITYPESNEDEDGYKKARFFMNAVIEEIRQDKEATILIEGEGSAKDSFMIYLNMDVSVYVRK
jgi:hypothetical protein